MSEATHRLLTVEAYEKLNKQLSEVTKESDDLKIEIMSLKVAYSSKESECKHLYASIGNLNKQHKSENDTLRKKVDELKDGKNLTREHWQHLVSVKTIKLEQLCKDMAEALEEIEKLCCGLEDAGTACAVETQAKEIAKHALEKYRMMEGK